MKVLFVLLVCSAAVAMAQRRPGGGRGPGGRGRGPRYTCDDGEKADCDRATKTCTCADGSTPLVRSPCADGADVQCPGACPDGSDAIFSSDPINNPPCGELGVKPNKKLCSCADGTELGPGRGNGRGNGRRG